MKKSLFVTFFVLILSVFALAATASAAQTTQFPVDLIEQYTYPYAYTEQGVLDNFFVYYVSPADEYNNLIYYSAYYTPIDGNPYLVMHCYDEAGYLLKTQSFNPDASETYIPRYTATIEIAVKYPYYATESYLYRNFITMYAPDGRSLRTTDLMVPAYEAVGWSLPVEMYAPDATGSFSNPRYIEVPPYEVEAHKAVGWYTFNDAAFKYVQELYNAAMNQKDYEGAVLAADEGLEFLLGTAYEDDLYAMRTKATNQWYNYSKKPMGLITYDVGEESGVPEVTLHFRNLTSKKIIAFKVRFTCHDVFGDLQETYYDYYYSDDAKLEVGERRSYTWDINGAEDVRFVKNINVFEVVYEDGTKWTGR